MRKGKIGEAVSAKRLTKFKLWTNSVIVHYVLGHLQSGEPEPIFYLGLRTSLPLPESAFTVYSDF